MEVELDDLPSSQLAVPIYSNLQEAHRLVQNDLNLLSEWCNMNQLTMNTTKTKGMLFGTKGRIKKVQLLPLKVNNLEIGYVHHYNYLGVKLDNDLSYELQVKETQKPVAHKIYLLSRIRPYLSKPQALLIYKTKVLPYFDYGDILYHQTGIRAMNKLQKL